MHRGTAIDPLLHVLSSFSTMDDLTDRISDIYKVGRSCQLTQSSCMYPCWCGVRLTRARGLQVLDVNETGGLTQEELSQRLAKLNVSPSIRFTEEDFEIITEGRKLCNDLGPARNLFLLHHDRSATHKPLAIMIDLEPMSIRHHDPSPTHKLLVL